MTDRYTFLTERLAARDWHEAERAGTVDDLPAAIAAMLTEPVTRWLPPAWSGPYTRARAEEWVAQRDAEGTVLLVEGREDGQPLGLVLLFEEAIDDSTDVRLGYLLGEGAWGHGLGGELLGGIVTWCRDRGDVGSIIGGVAPENTASIRLLARHGFVGEPSASHGGDLTYRLDLRA
jgi:RimJ/RimL family protein N-acetyltransferase